MGKVTEGLNAMRQECDTEIVGIAITNQVKWLVNPHPISEKTQTGDLALSSEFEFVKENNMKVRVIKNGIESGGRVVLSRGVHECRPCQLV